MTRFVVRPLRQTYPIWNNGLFTDPFLNTEISRIFGVPQGAKYGSAEKAAYNNALRLNLLEDETAFYAYAVIPGVNPDHLEISIQENKLSLRARSAVHGFGPQTAAEGETPRFRWLKQELPVSDTVFEREIDLPTAVNADQVSAAYENGILTLMLPKAESVKPRRITVKGTDNSSSQLAGA